LQSALLNVINQIRIFMKTFKKNLILIFIVFFAVSCSTSKDNKNTFVLIKTTLGDITVRLYDETPGHRDNFIKLVKNNVYDGLAFHRVIKDFMIQAGDPESKIKYVKEAADTLSSFTIPAEFNLRLFHKKGALAAAREGNDVNPEMRSSGTQFYIVQGTKYSDGELNKAEQRINNNLKQAMFVKIIKEITDSSRISGTNLKDAEIQEKASLRMFETMAIKGEYRIPEDHRSTYKTQGGTPRLDGTYTVFGEVVAGLDIVDKIAAVKTNESDRPITDIRILKMKLVHK
jgi:cyclophilin family peptidyl-prolyl cis-trans isomerase